MVSVGGEGNTTTRSEIRCANSQDSANQYSIVVQSHFDIPHELAETSWLGYIKPSLFFTPKGVRLLPPRSLDYREKIKLSVASTSRTATTKITKHTSFGHSRYNEGHIGNPCQCNCHQQFRSTAQGCEYHLQVRQTRSITPIPTIKLF